MSLVCFILLTSQGVTMYQIFKHIKEIAKDKNRDVIFIDFTQDKTTHPLKNYISYYYAIDTNRINLINWLRDNKISYMECYSNGTESYMGELYIDVPVDENNEDYIKLSRYLENENEYMKTDCIHYNQFSLSEKIKYA